MALHHLGLQQCFLKFCSSNLKWGIQLFVGVPVLGGTMDPKMRLFQPKPPLVGTFPQIQVPPTITGQRQELVKRLMINKT